jgi:hypothetical protein
VVIFGTSVLVVAIAAIWNHILCSSTCMMNRAKGIDHCSLCEAGLFAFAT